MNKKLNGILVKKITESIPKSKKTIEYITDVLKIGRESTYRRIRGDIPFTFEEISKLALNLNFSVDEIIGRNMGNYNVFSDSNHEVLSDLDERFFTIHSKYYDMINLVGRSKEMDIVFSINKVNSFLLSGFDVLFKFYYYKWMLQYGGTFQNQNFSEIEIPCQTLSVKQKINSAIKAVKNVTFIVDQNTLVKLMREIQCYYSRKLISEEDFLSIKTEMLQLLDSLEALLQTGVNKEGTHYYFYLSLLDIDSNSIFGTYDENTILQYWIYADLANVTNVDIINSHKNWVASLKRYSVLISQSNELSQSIFLDRQRKCIDNITNDLYFNYG
jgi:hypothetical protein